VLTRTVGTIAALSLLALPMAAIPIGTLYNNLGVATSTNVSVSGSGPLYDSFSTGPNAINLTDVQLKLEIEGPILYRPPIQPPLLLRAVYWRPVAAARPKTSSGLRPRDGGGSITVALYADSSSSPGALLTDIGTLLGDSLTMSPGNYDFPLGSAYPLSANHRYWIGVSSGGSITGWTVAQDDTGVGVANQFWYADGMVHPNTDPPFQMLVTGIPQNMSPTPAPPTLILALAGLAAASLYLNRRKLGWSR
jgi:hypothetical protein